LKYQNQNQILEYLQPVQSPIDVDSPKSYKIPKKKTTESVSPLTQSPTPQEQVVFDPVPPELPIPIEISPKEVLSRWCKQFYGNYPIYRETLTQDGIISSVTLQHLGMTISHQIPSKNIDYAENQSSLRAIEHLWKIRKQKYDQKFDEKINVNIQRERQMDYKFRGYNDRGNGSWVPPPPSYEKRF